MTAFENTGPDRPGGGHLARIPRALSSSSLVLCQWKSKADGLCGPAVAADALFRRLPHGELVGLPRLFV